MKVAVYSAKPFEIKYLEEANAGQHTLVYIPEALSMASLHWAKGCQAISTFTNDDASAEVLQTLHQEGIRYIATRATGYDNIALSQARSLGMQAANVREYSPYAIAEHAVALMLSLNRKLTKAHQKAQQFDFLLDDLIGFDMHGKTVGILGCGKIGAVVAKILHGFGCKLLIHDPVEQPDLVQRYQATYCSLPQLAQKSDIISIHVPLNEHTKYLINSPLIAQMKRGVMLVNTGRGGVVNTRDVLGALQTGQIGYLGLDVYEYEKGVFFFDRSTDGFQDSLLTELLQLPNVLITGHQAFLTETALRNIAEATVQSFDQWAKGEKSANEL